MFITVVFPPYQRKQHKHKAVLSQIGRGDFQSRCHQKGLHPAAERTPPASARPAGSRQGPRERSHLAKGRPAGGSFLKEAAALRGFLPGSKVA